MTPSIPISDKALSEAVQLATAEVDAAQERLTRADEELRAAERELALLVELGRLRKWRSGAANGEGPASDERLAASALDSPPPVATRTPRRDALVQTVIDILREHGEPMPIRALMAEVESRGAPIPGRGEQANLISVITRVPDIRRPARGMYGLREWQRDGAPTPAARRASTRRKGKR